MVGDGGVRIGDAERREVDQRLQRATGEGLLTLGEYDERSAVVWAARTRDELAVVLADLPAGVATTTAARPAGSGEAKARWAVAVMSEQRLSGPVLPGQRSHSVAVMGHGLIDLRRSDLPPVVNVSATAVMGAIEVLVPEGARVEANGIALMGNRDVRVAPAMPGAPLIRVHATAVMGHVEIRHKRLGRKDSRREGMAHRLDNGTSARDEGLARSERHRPRREERYDGRNRPAGGRHRRGKIGIIAAVLLLTAGGAVAAAATGDQVGAFGDQTVTVSPAQNHIKVAEFFGNARVRLAPNQCVNVTGTHIFGDVNYAACKPGQTPVTVRADGAFGDIDIVTAP